MPPLVVVAQANVVDVGSPSLVHPAHQDRPEAMDSPDNPEAQDNPVPTLHQHRTHQPQSPARPVPQLLTDNQDYRDHQDPTATRDQQERTPTVAEGGHPDLQDQPDHQDSQEDQELGDHQDSPVKSKTFPEDKAHQDQQAHQGPMDSQEDLDNPAMTDRQAHQAHQETTARQEAQEILARTASQEPTARPVQRAPATTALHQEPPPDISRLVTTPPCILTPQLWRTPTALCRVVPFLYLSLIASILTRSRDPNE